MWQQLTKSATKSALHTAVVHFQLLTADDDVKDGLRNLHWIQTRYIFNCRLRLTCKRLSIKFCSSISPAPSTNNDLSSSTNEHRWPTLTYTHTRLTALCPGLPGWAGTRKVKPIWILLKQETVSGSGISWDICKSAPRSKQIIMPAPHRSVFYRPDALPAAHQQCQSTEGIHDSLTIQFMKLAKPRLAG